MYAPDTNSKRPQLSIFGNTCVPMSEDNFQNFYLSGLNAVAPNLAHPITKTTADGTHAFVGLSDLLSNDLAKATPFVNFTLRPMTVPTQRYTNVIHNTISIQTIF